MKITVKLGGFTLNINITAHFVVTILMLFLVK
jgi:hypothetical protein